MRTARLDEIMRQKDPALKEVVEQLARGNVRQAVDNLQRQGRIREIVDPQERLKRNRASVCGESRKYAGDLAG